ncbi:hypothetical protein V3851_25425 [Paenibacillus sp. M1]|uniref:N-acetyltransferase domain-containing protein n=1 Tax=Paenibacillus haidiansis TaxID=1574488 RepID=A0ABU7VZC0_9BACL
MYKLVETVEEELMFNKIWTEAWLEQGFELEFSEEAVGRCLVFDEAEMPVATVEMKPYTPEMTGLNRLAPFNEHPAILADPWRTVEVDKVALHKEHRGKNLDRLLATIVLFAEERNIRNYVTLLEPVLFRALKISFHVPMSRVGERFFYKGADVIPAIIHAAEFYEHKESYEWFMETTKAKGAHLPIL